MIDFKKIGEEYKKNGEYRRKVAHWKDHEQVGRYAVAVALGINGLSLRHNDRMHRDITLDSVAHTLARNGFVPREHAHAAAHRVVREPLPYAHWHKHSDTHYQLQYKRL